MFVDKQRTLFRERILGLGRWLAAPSPEPPATDSADWYAGLCANPRGFTDQLCQLQNSLHRADHPAAAAIAPEGVAPERVAREIK